MLNKFEYNGHNLCTLFLSLLIKMHARYLSCIIVSCSNLFSSIECAFFAQLNAALFYL